MRQAPLKIAWISFFPIEWLPTVPNSLASLPKQHPASWQRVLLDELKGELDLKLHVFSVRKHFRCDLSFESEGVAFHCVKVPSGMRTLSLFWWETILIGQRLKRIQPDLVHAWGTERGAALVGSRLRYPYLVTMQGLLEWYQQQVDAGWLARLEARLEKTSLRRASVATVESSFGLKWLRDHYPRLEALQAEHAPSWTFHRLQRQPASKPLRFLYVGTLSLIKGTDLLLEALDALFSEFEFQLTIAGFGSRGFFSRLNAYASRPVWQRITWRRELTRQQVAEELAQTTLLLFPTRADTSPNAVKEAVVAGVPVIASEVGGIPDYVVPGRNGLLFPRGDVRQFICAIRAATVHPLFGIGRVDPQTLDQMREYLSPTLMREKFLAAYARVLERAKPAGCKPIHGF